MPWFWTEVGNNGMANCTRFWTITKAVFNRCKSNVTVASRAVVAICEDMYSMPATPLTAAQWRANVSATTWALGPRVGDRHRDTRGVIGGYWAIGRYSSAIPPVSEMKMESTAAKIGRSMKNREIMVAPGPDKETRRQC